MNKFVCIHGHFYQPPRENPWLEDVELQDSAHPFHDWNHRITEECYSQNAVSRILGSEKKIVDIVNNYTQISFNFGPTLLAWLEKHQPKVYRSILQADKDSREIFSGHGSAIAQAYNHTILPLSNQRDKHTQVLWGIEDFKQRFDRFPEGMWLPETAVDTPTLEVLAENGIKFTILAPYQAKRFRKIGDKKLQQTKDAPIDTSVPYLCNLPSGKSIALFFYEGGVSHNVAYGGLLHSGEKFAKELTGAFKKEDRPQLVHIATDGETYGHHHRYGDMALAYCMYCLKKDNLAEITIYGEYLEKFPPEYEVEIEENTSWSCAHGVERWKSNCGCAVGRFPSGKQQWRKPLREAMDRLNGELADIYEKEMKKYHPKPWELRDRYIEVIRNRNRNNVENFLSKNIKSGLKTDEKIKILKLLEMQRSSLLMQTSCGWFFDDISGIETVQIIKYAARGMQLAREVTGEDLESDYKEILKQAPSNNKSFENGYDIYEKMVSPASVDLNRVGAHLALTSLFQEYPGELDIFCYTAEVHDYERTEAGIQKLATGRATISSNITLEQYSIDFAVLHLGEQNLTAAVNGSSSKEEFSRIKERLKETFQKGNTTEVMRIMDVEFEGNSYSLWHLFKDQQRHILYELLDTTWKEVEASFRQIYEHNYTVMKIMHDMRIPLPKAFSAPAEFVLNQDLSRCIKNDQAPLKELKKLTEEVKSLSLKLDEPTLQYEAGNKITRLMHQLEKTPDDINLLTRTTSTLEILLEIIPELNLQRSQNVFFSICKKRKSKIDKQAKMENENSKTWLKNLEKLGHYLGVKLPCGTE